MKIFMDTANVEEIREFADMGIVYGVTTNPSLVAKSGRTQAEVIPEISSFNLPKSAASSDGETVTRSRVILRISRISSKNPCM